MTLCVAVTVPCKALNPKRRPLVFAERGIILAADTRYSYKSGSTVDDGIKVWSLADWAIAGFSASNLRPTEAALVSMALTIDDLGFRGQAEIARGTASWLRYYRRSPNQNETGRTDVLLATYDRSVDRFFLYELSSVDDFKPSRREGVRVVGSGADMFNQAFVTEVDLQTARWAAPVRSGLKLVPTEKGVSVVPRQIDDHVNVRLIDVATLVTGTLDLVVQKAGIPTVGGLVKVVCLTNTGIVHPVGRRRSADGSWHDVTARDLRSYSEMTARRYDIPRMRDDLTIAD